MVRVWFRSAASILVCWFAFGVSAQGEGSPLAPDAGRFIESVVVEGLAYASPDLIMAEARVAGGQVYAEADLRDAIHRIRRLPFVRDAVVTLRRGSLRGRYQLVIAVEETRRTFFGGDAILTRADPALVVGRGRPREHTAQATPQVGGRLFVGRYNVFFGAVGGTSGAQVGYQRYNLLGRGGVLSMAVQRATCCSTQVHDLGLDPTFSVWRDEGETDQFDLGVDWPLRGRQSLHVAYGQRRSDEGLRRFSLARDDAIVSDQALAFGFEDLRRHQLEVSWRRDSTDDPLFPNQGSLVRVGVEASTLTAGQHVRFVTAGSLDALASAGSLGQARTEQLRLVVAAERTWSIGRRHAVALGIRGSAGKGRIANLPVDTAGDFATSETAAGPALLIRARPNVWSAGVTARYRMDLTARGPARQWGEVYWQSQLRLDLDDSGLHGLSGGGRLDSERLESVRLETAIAWRSAWGLVRLTLQLIELST